MAFSRAYVPEELLGHVFLTQLLVVGPLVDISRGVMIVSKTQAESCTGQTGCHIPSLRSTSKNAEPARSISSFRYASHSGVLIVIKSIKSQYPRYTLYTL